ncbi:LacI family transcriptional regulator (plasmid) [Deinococcus psychrotolerans]|uniref:LacI family transcriptional regulator n=1 Tax=Deinococcus psychrotolerans TaxID=2489213 RepID=A0A3G8YGW8_9DEIO|nr:LacI family DNA-binding transcriptional regulator [Deinococcus psychrotolerans]AZI44569.1 LacI family transcriptional regulator [Deinococcus psychrotolerans]
MPSITDVAKQAGVSPTTAKRALKTPHLLHPETLAKVMEAVSKLHYEPDLRAGALRAGQSRTVGVVLGSVVEPFFAQLARTLGQELRRGGYNMLLTENEYQSAHELTELKLLYGQRIDALILRAGYGDESREYLERLHKRGVFIVQVDYCLPGATYPSVMLGNVKAVREAVQYLYGLGHRRIAATGKYDPLLHPEGRSYTFPTAMAEVGLEVRPEYERVMFLTEENTYQYTLDVMRLACPPTALLALTGASAAGCYRALQELGLKVPDDVSLLSFDNYSWMSLVSPAITVLAQPIDDMARAAAQMVLRALSGEDKRPADIVFPAELIVRGSCAPPQAQRVLERA